MKRVLLIAWIGMVIISFLYQVASGRVAVISEEWAALYSELNNTAGLGNALAVDDEGNVYVTGYVYREAGGYDYVTIKYDPEGIILWAATYQGPGLNMDISHALAIDESGCVYITGRSKGAGTESDVATIKYDPNGVELWAVRYNEPDNKNEIGRHIELDPFGNVYVGGTSWSDDTNDDCLTIKYDSAGNELWVARYNGPADLDELVSDMCIDDQGNVYITGGSRGDVTSWDVATIKYDTNGNQLWVASYEGPANDEDWGEDLAVDDQGNVYVVGGSIGVDSGYDCITLKYDADGNQIWMKRYNGPANNDDEGRSLALDAQANVYVTGYSTAASWDYTTIKYDTNGNPLWVTRYDGPDHNDDSGRFITLDVEGNTYIVGSTIGDATDKDITAVKYDSNGNMLWDIHYDGPAHTYEDPKAFVLDEEQNIYITGRATADYGHLATIKYVQVDSVFGTKCTAKAGKKANTDSLKFYGDFTATDEELTIADTIDITIWSESGFEYAEPPIPFSSDEMKKGKFKYKKKVPKGELGGVTSFQFDTNKQRFTLTAGKMSLNGLNSPMGVDVIIGDYLEVSVADESIINNKKPIPMTLMRNYADTLRVDKAKVKAGKNPDTDSVKVQGGIAADNTLTNPCVENLVISWAGQTFTVAKETITVEGDNLYAFKNVTATEGGTVTGSIDLAKCTFKIDIKDATITNQTGSVKIELTFEGFHQSEICDL